MQYTKMAPKRQKMAIPIGSSCPHLDALTQMKRRKLLDSIWSSLTKSTHLQDQAHTLQCVTCGRQSADAAEHKAAHPGKKVPAGHELALDTSSGEIYCTVCNDFVYDFEVDRAVTALLAAKNENILPREKSLVEEEPPAMISPIIMGSPQGAVAIALATDAATAVSPAAEIPPIDGNNNTTSDPSSLTAAAGAVAAPPNLPYPSFLPLPRQVDDFPAGLRGLNNMGHTCFMNSILQAFLHTPLLLEHHLAHGHSCGNCLDGTATITTSFSTHHMNDNSGSDPCLACELDRVFSEAYSGNRVPLSPASFLHAWWSMAGGDLGGGCKQQDAHEFFLFMLQMISSVNGNSTGSAATNSNEGTLLSKLFDGSIRSDVVCCACCAASTTIEHFTNLSLDIPPPTRLLPPPIVPRPKAQATNAKSGKGAAAAKAGKQLVGAAKAAHLAKLNRQNSGKGVAALMLQPEPTPEPSSQFLVDLTMEESMASELTSGGGDVDGAIGGGAEGARPASQIKIKKMFNRAGRGAAATVRPRPSPPTEGMNAPQPEQGSGINALGATVLGAAADGGEDTLSSPQRKRAAAAAAAANVKSGSLPPRSSSSPSADGIDPQQIQAAAAVAAAAAGPGAFAHPALAQYLHWPGESLIGCLRRFVWPEQLGTTGRWRCSKCGSEDGAVKQLSLARLPPILVLHAKRFEHAGGTRATAKKLDTYLSFPLEDLDMAPYLTAEALKSRHVARPTPPSNDKAAAPVTGLAATMSTPVPVLTTGAAAAAAGGSRGGRSRPMSAVAGDSTIRRTRSAAAAVAAATATATATAAVAGVDKSGGGGGGRTRSTAMTRSASAAAISNALFSDGINSSGDAPRVLQSPSSTALPSTAHNNADRGKATVGTSSAPSSASMYDLFAVVCHRGTFQGGHYVAYVRASDGNWYLCDDAYVQRVNEEVVRTSQAYMLFYGQKGLLPWNSRGAAR